MLVLIVEDHAGCRTAMARALEAKGHTAVTARTAEEAVMLAGDFPFEAVISDIHLPDKSGRHLMKCLKKQRPDLLGIAVSGDSTSEAKGASLAAGFSDHLGKPLDFDTLVSMLGRVQS